jgi:hypothetical protein
MTNTYLDNDRVEGYPLNLYYEGAVEDIAAYTQKYFPLWKKEFYDFYKVIEMGAKKYDADGWLAPDGKGTSHKQMHDSMFHHLAKSYSGVRLDDESQLDHLLHVATRAMMLYTRLRREIKNPQD